MALWQFTIALIPRQWARANHYETAALYTEEGFETDVAWAGNELSQSVMAEAMDAIFPRSAAWDNELTMWGDDKTSDIKLWSHSGKIEDVTVRLNLRDDITAVMSHLCDTVKSLDLVCFIPDMQLIVNPDTEALMSLARRSNAASFVKDPENHLRNC